MQTNCPKCNNSANTSILGNTVKHNQEFVFVCTKCHHSFGAKLSFVHGMPHNAEAFNNDGQTQNMDNLADIY